MDNTKYQITKTVRFKLVTMENESTIVTSRIKLLVPRLRTKSLVTIKKLLDAFIKDFKAIIYKVDSPMEWDWSLSVKKKWLNSYRRDMPQSKYYDSDVSSYAIKDLQYVQVFFNDIWIPRIEDIYKKLKQYSEENEELQSRDTIISTQIWKLNKRTTLRLGKDFVSCLKSKDGDKLSQIQKMLNNYGVIETEIKNLTYGYLPSQSCGLLVAGGSFNYFTINKRRTNFENERKEIQKQLDQKHSLSEYIQKYKENNKIENKFLDELLLKKIEYKNELDDQNFVYIDFENEKFALVELVMHLKNYMRYQKKLFNNAIQLIATNTDKGKKQEGESKRKKCALYEFKDNQNDWKAFIDSWEAYLTPTTPSEKDKSNKSDKSDKKQFIDSHYVKKGNIDNTQKFKVYQDFCGLLKELSGNLGKLNNQLLGIDKEAVTAELLKYWCFILRDENGEDWVYCVPKEKEFNPNDEKSKLSQAYAFINKKSSINDKTTSNALFYLCSLTRKALAKLCFGSEDFQASLKCNTQFFTKYGRIEKEDDLKSDVQKIKYFQAVLKTIFDNPDNFKSLKIEFVNFKGLEKLANEEIENLSDFDVRLNSICYKRMVVVEPSVKKTLIDSYNAFRFKITSQDIRNKNKTNFSQRSLTEVWNNYWNVNSNSDFDTRLNPEVKIYWRDKRVHEDQKYGKHTELFDTSKRNRYLHDQYTLALSFTQNANCRVFDRSFDTIDENLANVKDFNDKISESNYALGIDVNKDDLAYATLVKKDGNRFVPQIINENNNSFEVWKLKDDVFKNPDSDIYNFGLEMPYPDHTIRTDNKFRVIKNVSFFVNKKAFDKTFNNDENQEKRYSFADYPDKLFDKNVKITSLSLTRAKVFGNIVVIDGDLTTHAKLKFLNAKRRIVNALHDNHDLELCYNTEEENKIICDETKRKFYIGSFNKEGKFCEDNTIYVHNMDYETIYSWNKVKEELEKLIDEAKKDLKSGINLQETMATASTIHHINNIRKVMAGNMVAVIKKIYDSHPCYVCFENFDEDHTESRRKNEFDGDIYRPLERALLNSFKAYGVVPVVNELIAMRNRKEILQNDISQLGIIKYVPDTNTSKLCPKCGQKAYDDDDVFNEDKKKHIFKCQCGYNNQTDTEFGLKNNDAVAAFNIAKLSFNNKERVFYVLKPKFTNSSLKNIAFSMDKNIKTDAFDEARLEELETWLESTDKEQLDQKSADYKELENLRKCKWAIEGYAIRESLKQNGIHFCTSLKNQSKVVIVKGNNNKETFKDKNVITEDEFLQIINPLIHKEE